MPNGHGTHVAGTIAAVGNNGTGGTGVSWSAKIMALRFLDAWGNGTTANAICGHRICHRMGADIINNSWGGSGYNQSLKDAIEASGALVVCAAGNSGWNTDTFIRIIRPVTTAPTLLRWRPATRMTTGVVFKLRRPVSVDVAAPGTNIYSTAPGRETVWQDTFRRRQY